MLFDTPEVDNGFKTKTCERITQKIFDLLKEKDPDVCVNFETILRVIEDLYAYWSSRASKEKNNLYGFVDLDEILALSKGSKNSYISISSVFSALDRDCLEASELYLIGYYGDEHTTILFATPADTFHICALH